jgi:hypothetical protein
MFSQVKFLEGSYSDGKIIDPTKVLFWLWTVVNEEELQQYTGFYLILPVNSTVVKSTNKWISIKG